MMTNVRILGLHCEACTKFCTLKFKKLGGIESVTIQLPDGETSIVADREVSIEELNTALAGTDFSVSHAL